jgi:predicted glycosyltransferase
VRAVLICNEMLGLGHLRLSLALAAGIVEHEHDSTALVLTGSPAAGSFVPPTGVDIVKLPTSPLDTGSRWRSTQLRPAAGLALAAPQVHRLRAGIVDAVVSELRPDVVIVDYRPLGRGEELLGMLRKLRASGTCTIALGLWEVDDDPAELAGYWDDALVHTTSELYDLVFVYGPSDPDDIRVARLSAHGLPVHSTAHVAHPPATAGPDDLESGYLLVTAGGGVDGHGLMAAVIEAVRLRPLERETILITGPLMSANAVRDLRVAALGLRVRIETFRPDMNAVIAGARAVISMAGYNTAAEVVASGRPALLAPRTFPRREQLNRALRWRAAGRVELLSPDARQPAALRRAIETLLEREPRPPEVLTGATDVATILAGSLRERAAG